MIHIKTAWKSVVHCHVGMSIHTFKWSTFRSESSDSTTDNSSSSSIVPINSIIRTLGTWFKKQLISIVGFDKLKSRAESFTACWWTRADQDGKISITGGCPRSRLRIQASSTAPSLTGRWIFRRRKWHLTLNFVHVFSCPPQRRYFATPFLHCCISCVRWSVCTCRTVARRKTEVSVA